MKIVRLDQIVPLALAGLLLTASPLRAQPVVTARARPVIAAGFHHTVALKADGTLWAWGDNGFGQLGIGAKLGQGTNAPAQIGTDQDWATVAVGPFHTLAVKANGTLWSWGANRAGQLGLGGELNENANAPARVGLDRDWSMVAAWGGQSLGLKTDGSLWAWGDFNRTNGPAQVGTDLEWSWMGPRYSKTLAVKTDGSLWELNSNGGIPIGTDNDWEIVVSTEGTYFSTISMSDTVALKSWTGLKTNTSNLAFPS